MVKSNTATFAWPYTRAGSPIRDLEWRPPLFKEHSSFNMIDTVSFTENPCIGNIVSCSQLKKKTKNKETIPLRSVREDPW